MTSDLLAHMCRPASPFEPGRDQSSFCILNFDLYVSLNVGDTLFFFSFCVDVLLLACFRVRALGTAAVDMCQVATGGADAYYHIGMHCWDIAASAIIVREAGGVVRDTDGLYLPHDAVSPFSCEAASNWSVCPQAQSLT